MKLLILPVVCLVLTGLLTLPCPAYDHLYANDGAYLGNTNQNTFDPDSIYNRFGRYGSRYSDASVNNPYGAYGSRYSQQSPRNPYTQPGLRVPQDYGYATQYGGWGSQGRRVQEPWDNYSRSGGVNARSYGGWGGY